MKNVLIIAFLALSGFVFSQNPNFVVLLDSGHGGVDTGAMVDDIKESDLTLLLTQKVADALRSFSDYKVLESRTSDILVNLDERVQIINSQNVNLVVSLHINFSDDPSQKGLSTYYSNENSQGELSRNYAQILSNIGYLFDPQSNVNTTENVNSRILKESNCPAIMINLGYLSNAEDKAFLTQPNNQEILAQAIAKNILRMTL